MNAKELNYRATMSKQVSIKRTVCLSWETNKWWCTF